MDKTRIERRYKTESGYADIENGAGLVGRMADINGEHCRKYR